MGSRRGPELQASHIAARLVAARGKDRVRINYFVLRDSVLIDGFVSFASWAFAMTEAATGGYSGLSVDSVLSNADRAASVRPYCSAIKPSTSQSDARRGASPPAASGSNRSLRASAGRPVAALTAA